MNIVTKDQAFRYIKLSGVAVVGSWAMNFAAQKIGVIGGLLDKLPSPMGLSLAMWLLAAISFGIYDRFTK